MWLEGRWKRFVKYVANVLWGQSLSIPAEKKKTKKKTKQNNNNRRAEI